MLVKGLQDPLVPAIETLVPKYGFTRDEIQFQMALYQSLDPSLALERTARLLDTPKTVALSAYGQQLIVAGTASQQWFDFAVKLKDRLPGFSTVNFDRLKIDEWSQATVLRQELDGTSFYFNDGIAFNAEQQDILQIRMDKVGQLMKLLGKSNADVRFVVTGYTDGAGNVVSNQALKLKRAETIKQQLVKYGVQPASVSIVAGQVVDDADKINPLSRKADLHIQLLRPN